MRKLTLRLTKLGVFMLILFSGIPAVGQVPVLTQHNDNARTGQNLQETLLNTSTVNQSNFGKVFWRTVDGFIYAQPLYVPGLTIQGATHNVVYVATQHNSVYAFDADNPNEPAPLWQVNLGTPVPSQDICILTGDTNPSDCPYYDISPEIGITSTPVIDTTAGIIYVVSRTKNTSNSTYHDYLHALDLITGAERLGGPAEILGQVAGTGAGSVGGVLTFDPAYHNQRPSLLLANGVLYLCFGSVGDIGTFHGWVMSYNATTLQQEAIISITPNGTDGGVWSSGQGLVADASGNVYVMTGNGDFNANTGGKDYGDSFLKFSGASLTISDYFTPSNQATLNSGNVDLGSGGPMLMPGTTFLVGMGKDGIFRVVSTASMGGYNSGVDNDVQEFSALSNPYYSSPVYWNSPNNGPMVYVWGPGDSLKAFQFNGSKFSTSPISQSTIQNSSGESNAAPISISANGSQQGTGIVWTANSISQWASGIQIPGVVRAFDATNLTSELWDSTQNLARDDVGGFAKFNPPTITNGKVYVGSFSGQLQVYGLNPPAFQGIRFVQVASATPQSTTSSVAVAYPSAQTATDLNVVIVGWNDTSATVQSVTDTAGNVYSLAVGPTSGTGLRQSIYYAKNIASSSNNTVTVTFNQGATKPDVRILEYSGADTSNPFDVAVGVSGNGNVADSGFVNTNAANELVVGGHMIASNTTVMAGAPFTPRVFTSPDSGLAADRLVNVPGSYHSWGPLKSSGAWVEQVATFKSATVSQVPFVNSMSPNNGPIAGGTSVTITGVDFATGATVTFGGGSATNVVVVNATTITATTPAGSAGAVAVTVTNTGGQSGSLANGFTYVAPPTVSGVSPNTGSTSGGTSVTITGTNFASGATVKFGSAAATNVVVVNATTITATTPAGSAGAVTVTVTVSGQSGSLTNGFTYAVVPTVSGVSPNSGPVAGGTSVTITGTNFATGATVTFGSGSATNVVVVNSTTITATTPAGSAGAVTVTVTVSGQSGSLTNGFTYIGVPTVTSVSPNTGSTSGGTSVTITGTNFAAGATVTFGSGSATNVVVVNSTTITATTPAGSAGAVTVTVTNVGSQSGSLTNGFTYAVVPTVSSVSPNSGPVAGGTAVTITGTNFATGATVKFGSTAATGVTVVNSTTITASTPASGSAGAVTVTVTVGGQSGSLANGFTYTGSIAIAFGQVAAATPQTPTASVPVTYPAAQTAGDLNIVVVGWNDTTSTVQSVKDSAGNNYVLAVGPTAGTGLQQSIYYASNIVGGSNTVTVTFSAAAAYPDVRILEYRGVTALDVTAGTSGNSASASSGAATTTVANELIFGANTVSTLNGAAGSGFTSRIITTPDGDIAEDKIVTTAGSNSATATLTGSGPWVMQMATFAAVTGPVPTVSSVSPNGGTTAGGTSVTITGTNFASGATVTFGSGSATNVVVVNATTITATTPAGSAGAVTVTVTVGGQSGSLASGFTYVAPPTVSSVSPNGGTTAGGTSVTITGTNFASGATVTFSSGSATNVVVVSGTTITATTPAGSAGAVTVTVTVSGQSGSLANGYTYTVPPTVSSVSPNTGSTSGGTSVTITGTNFATGATVTFGSGSATNVVVVNSTTITTTTPAGSAGAVTVTVTNVGSQSGSLTNGYTYVVAPTVSSVSPNTGSTAGGTAVTITGTNFATGATVTFGSGSATNVVVVNSTTITATTPAGSAGAVTVTVTNTGGQSGNLTNGFTYVAPPTVSSVSPNTGSTSGGTSVTITGTNFASGATVKFGSGSATNVVVVNATTITATTPAGSAGAVTVTVTVSGQSGSLTNGFTYAVVPTVSGVSPNSGPVAGGTSVTITGTNFATGATVTFGSGSATNVVVVNSTTITATTPAGSAGAVTVTVTVSGQSGSLTNGFTYIGVPTVTSVSPNTGSTSGGTSVTITGTNFAAGATVTFGSGSATNVVVVNSTTITATTPAGSAGAVTVTVTNVGSQSGSLTNGFTYAVVPTVSSVSPNSGPVAGGTAVTITGTNFATGATVKFGSTAATGVTVVNSTTITASTPASGSAGAVTVTVTVGGQSGSLANGFTYTGSIAIAFGQVAAATPQTPTASVPVTYPAAQTAGDLNIVVVGWNDTTSTVQSVKDSAGNNYVLAVGPTAGTGLQQSIYYASNIVGGSNTVTVTFSAAAAYPDVRILEYRGVTALDVTAGTSGNSASASSGAATTTVANELIFGANTVSTLNGAAGSGFTSRIITTPDGDIAEDKIVTTAGSNSATATLTGSGPWVMQMATFSAGPTPTVGSVNPNMGSTAGGTSVTIAGTNFASGATVTFGSGSATNVVVVNATTITATTPAGSAGVATVTVTNPGGEASSLASGYTYIAPPAVSSVNPSNAGLAGGTSVTITGTNFASGATVTFGSESATNVVVVNATTITATTPAESAGTVAVTVTNTSGLSGSLASGFTYIAPPTVTNVNPNTGPTAGGASVTITGTNFLSGASVTFGGTAATSVVVVNSTTITATTPVGNAGAVTVTVTVGAQSGSLTNGYTYSSQVVVVTPPDSFAGVLAGTAAPTYVAGQQYYNATAGTSFTTAAFNSTGADLLLMFLGCHNATVFTITDTYGNTWIPLAGPAYKVGNPSYPMEGEFFYVPNAKTGAGHTITVTLSQTEPLVASIVAVAGDNIYSPIDTYSPITGDNGTLSKYISSTPLTTSQPNDLILGIVKGYGNNTYTAGAGYTSQLSSTGNNFSAETQAAASVGSYNSYFTATTSDFWQSVTAAISPMLTQSTLSWTASTGGIISNYDVERCVGLGCTSFSQIASVPSTSLSYSDTTIAAGTIYNYRVRAQNTVGTFSAYSNTLTFSPIIPQVVSSFTATQTGKLVWKASSESGGSISQYSVERCTGTGCTNFSQIATTSATSYTDTSVAASTTYNYRVRAQDANGFYGPYSVVASASLPAYFDNAADGGNNGGTSTSLTYSYSVGTNANRLLLVSVVGDPSVDDISSATYGGSAMTMVAKIQTPSDRWHYLYYLLSPASGANNVVITAASSHTLMSEASSWFNIAQSGQPGAFSTNTSPTNVSTMTTSLPASSNNAIVAESMWAPLQILPGNGSSELALDAAMLSLGMFSSVPNPVSQAYPVSITNTWGGQFAASSIMASFTLASNGTAGITYDNTKDGGNNGGTTASLTYSYKVGTGSNRLLVVNLIGDTSADDISSVTYAGTLLTLVKKVQSPSNNWQYVYYLLNPTSGTNNVVITAGSTHYLISQAASWSNVKQSAQPDAVTTNTAPATNTSITTSLTTVAPGCLVVQGVWSYGHLTAGPGSAEIITDAALDGAGIFVSGQSPVTPAGNVSMTSISDGTTSSGAIMVSFAPAP